MSNFRPDTGGRRWSLVQLRWFSPAAAREGRCRQMSPACAGRTRSVLATLGLPRSRGCAFPVYTAQAPSCSIGRERALRCMRFQFSGIPQKRGLGWACVLCLPCPSGSGSQELDGRTLPGAMRLLPSVLPASVSAHAGWVRLVSLLGSWPLAATLPADVSHPESQEVFG